MNRLLQHFVDSGGAQAPPATRPPIPVPPQSSGGSHRAGRCGSFQRTTPDGPFYYQPPKSHSGLEEIPLTSQSTGATYETVDLNADTSQQHWDHRPPSSREENRLKALSSASELFTSGSPPTRELVCDNPYRCQSMTSFASGIENVARIEKNALPWKDPLTASTPTDEAMFTDAAPKHPFSAQENLSLVTSEAAYAPPAVQSPTHPCPPQRQPIQQQPVDVVASSVTSSPFNSLAPSNGVYQSADSLFASSVPSNNTKWVLSHTVPAQAQEVVASNLPSASTIFENSSPFQATTSFQTITPSPPTLQVCALPSPGTHQVNALEISQTNLPTSPIKPPLASPPSQILNASSSSLSSQDSRPASRNIRPEDQVIGSMKPSLKSGLDVRHMKYVAKKRDDDAVSNAPSVAPSRMSMFSTLDDSLKLSDMYKHMARRLEGEKHDLLKVVANQAQEMAQMHKHIESLERQVKTCRLQDASWPK